MRASLPDDCVVPALTGKELVMFIETKGQLRGLNVQWFRMKKGKSVRRLGRLYWGDHFGEKHSARLSLADVVPVDPVYGSPFKFGPMSAHEFDGSLESSMMLLRSELEEETDDEERLTEEEGMKLFQEKLLPPA